MGKALSKSVVVQGKFLPGLNCLEDICVRRRDFSMDVELYFMALFLKDQKLNKKKFFLN